LALSQLDNIPDVQAEVALLLSHLFLGHQIVVLVPWQPNYMIQLVFYLKGTYEIDFENVDEN
jgi:hypothetical protein